MRLQLCISFLRFLFSVPFGGRDSVIVVKSTGRKIVDRFRRNARTVLCIEVGAFLLPNPLTPKVLLCLHHGTLSVGF